MTKGEESAWVDIVENPPTPAHLADALALLVDRCRPDLPLHLSVHRLFNRDLGDFSTFVMARWYPGWKYEPRKPHESLVDTMARKGWKTVIRPCEGKDA